ncbi:uncharacterized protein PG998_009026 [Apiospora kogelbergensis]|uniref:uncharacterized protein n=1 Tax=Apiospora kogelbergensis TaxID=1337665 RepID=UPI0031311545
MSSFGKYPRLVRYETKLSASCDQSSARAIKQEGEVKMEPAQNHRCSNRREPSLAIKQEETNV